MDRINLLEVDGLYFESDTHEWFKDNSTTKYAQMRNKAGISLPKVFAFVLRNKETGEYERALMDAKTNQVIYSHTSLEDVGVHIDKLKLIKQTE